MASKKLTSDEVNALMEGLQDSPQGLNIDVSASDDVRPFAFGEDDLSLMGDYYALRQVNERFARQARTVFLPMLGVAAAGSQRGQIVQRFHVLHLPESSQHAALARWLSRRRSPSPVGGAHGTRCTA